MIPFMEQTRSSLLVRLRDPDDGEGWSEFYALYEPFLMNVARRLGLNNNDCNDLVAEVFAKCVEKLPSFNYDRSRGSFRGWLKTTMRNLATDTWRQKKRIADNVPLNAGCEPVIHDEIWEKWDHEYHQRILERAIVVVHQQCSPHVWACFREHVLGGRRAADVAGELDLKTNAVYQNSHRVLNRVREQCAIYDEEVSDVRTGVSE